MLKKWEKVKQNNNYIILRVTLKDHLFKKIKELAYMGDRFPTKITAWF